MTVDGTRKRLAELTEYPPLNEDEDSRMTSYISTASRRPNPGVCHFNGVYQHVTPDKDPFNTKPMHVDADYVRTGAQSSKKSIVDMQHEAVLEPDRERRRDWKTLRAVWIGFI
ncbi:hypothetical protein JVU11DRAFT_11310 [Chiua virens]|nr:hypothetical protein JVU11DRAFT_11310 [Chiua virens]